MPVVVNQQLLVELFRADDEPGISMRSQPDGRANDPIAGHVDRHKLNSPFRRIARRPSEHGGAPADGQARGGQAGRSQKTATVHARDCTRQRLEARTNRKRWRRPRARAIIELSPPRATEMDATTARRIGNVALGLAILILLASLGAKVGIVPQIAHMRELSLVALVLVIAARAL